MQDNGSWAVTSDRLLGPVLSRAALGWQEELELYCHPGKNSTSIPEPPFRCMREAVSLFSQGGFNGWVLKQVKTHRAELKKTTRRHGYENHFTLTQSDLILPPY